MKRIAAGVLCLVLLLSGCGDTRCTPAQLMEEYQDTLAQARFQVRTCGSFACTYRLELAETAAGFSVTVLEPASVAGIRAEILPDGSAICYEDVTLDTLLPEPGGYAPADVLPGLLHQLRETIPAGLGTVQTTAGKRLQAEYQTVFADGTLSVKQLLLYPETLYPESAELYLDGELQLAVEFEEFSLTRREPVASEPRLWYTEAVTENALRP